MSAGRHAVADPGLTPLHHQIGRIMRSAADNLLAPDDWPYAAGVVLAVPTVATALAAARALDDLRELHREIRATPWPDSPEVATCSTCHVRWPCITAQTIQEGTP